MSYPTTTIGPDEEMEVRERPGFTHVACYGKGVDIQPNDIGAIVKHLGSPERVDGFPGLFTQEIEFIERFIAK